MFHSKAFFEIKHLWSINNLYAKFRFKTDGIFIAHCRAMLPYIDMQIMKLYKSILCIEKEKQNFLVRKLISDIIDYYFLYHDKKRKLAG